MYVPCRIGIPSLPRQPEHGRSQHGRVSSGIKAQSLQGKFLIFKFAQARNGHMSVLSTVNGLYSIYVVVVNDYARDLSRPEA